MNGEETSNSDTKRDHVAAAAEESIVRKKARLDNDDDHNDNGDNDDLHAPPPVSGAPSFPSDEEVEEIMDVVWQHFRDYIDSCEEQPGSSSGDVDELEEILDILQNNNVPLEPMTSLEQVTLSSRRRDLLPILVSIAHGDLAEHYISQHLTAATAAAETEGSKKDNQELVLAASSSLKAAVQHHLTQALTLFPWNAEVWSACANLCRMQVIPNTTTTDVRLIAATYERAVRDAVAVKQRALELLDAKPSHDKDEAKAEEEEDHGTKEWIELLLLDQICGVEWTVDNDDDANEEEGEGEEKQESKTTDASADDKEGKDEGKGYWSTSAVEETCRFMAAMLYSTIGKHDAAREHLQHFSVTHRLHPNVWTNTSSSNKTSTEETTDENLLKAAMTSKDEPVVFGRTGEPVLPPALYERLCQVFAPDAAYWKESDYSNRGYYSYYVDIDEQTPAQNVIEDVIINHLLPLARQKLDSQQQQQQSQEPRPDKNNDVVQICGAEWWVHTRPIQANLGHNLHFDTDEALLTQDKEVSHPILSSVLYLTGDSLSGPTIVLDQTPFSEDNAAHVWRNTPKDNSFLLFPGDRLHGVLPCPGMVDSLKDSALTDSKDIVVKVSDLFVESAAEQNPNLPQKHRLTFMVGFWTRRVPDRIQERKLYGPCGPLPPATSEHSWVSAIAEGYPKEGNGTAAASGIVALPVAKITPAWETLSSTTTTLSDEDGAAAGRGLRLPPRGIDHRFFVRGAPRCFYDAMFETDELENIDNDDDDDDVVVLQMSDSDEEDDEECDNEEDED